MKLRELCVFDTFVSPRKSKARMKLFYLTTLGKDSVERPWFTWHSETSMTEMIPEARSPCEHSAHIALTLKDLAPYKIRA